ncbi:hypothetical protein [Actinomadura fibrosa]|uniref:Uncharacterized protein n=1 Tax=Actinomadura fibrosa TaxID=111802 RepID=A0ABW2Y479_9ACTN|nr:hypothetical protein [Actinomadura fibrosa]
MLLTATPPAAPAPSWSASMAEAAPWCAAIVMAGGFLLALRFLSRDLRQIEARLHGDRAEAERRLQREYVRLRDEHSRDLLIDQLRRVGDLYAEYLAADEIGAASRRDVALYRLRVHLPAVPGRYCSLLKLRFDIAQGSESEREAARWFARHDRLPAPDRVSADWICQEFSENLRELMRAGGAPALEPRRATGPSLFGEMLRAIARRRGSRTPDDGADGLRTSV